ncbi:YceI family protein [Microbacterium lacusdiani]
MTALDASMNGDWLFDRDHTRVGFSARHAMVTKVRGAFNDVDGRIHVDVDHPENSWVEVRVQVASIDTRSAQRDEHLRSADFFDAETYPEIVFRSTAEDEVDENALNVIGDLTIRDITRQVSRSRCRSRGSSATRSATSARASRARAAWTAATSASSGTRRSTPAACSSPRRSRSSSSSRPSRPRRPSRADPPSLVACRA